MSTLAPTQKADEVFEPTEQSWTGRFTLDGSAALERRIEEICQRVLAGVRSVIPETSLEALLLAGGYGRGEGGVLKTAQGDEPYNDLEFYVCSRGNRFLSRRRYGGRLAGVAEELSAEAGLEVEFKIISLPQLRHAPPSMFYYDLVMGHRWLQGNESLLQGCEHHREASRIPPAEATRLLMNRCTGLLLAGEKLRQTDFDARDSDFVARNIAKAQLALGDAVLTFLGQYHWSCRERHRRLASVLETESSPSLAELFPHHRQGVDFKLHPHRSSASISDLDGRIRNFLPLGLQTWLWIESHRLGGRFTSARNYAFNPANKCPETNPWRNRLVNASVFGAAKVFAVGGGRHPRERLLNALPLLLWEDVGRDWEILAGLQHNLKTRSRTRAGLVDRYLRLWERVR